MTTNVSNIPSLGRVLNSQELLPYIESNKIDIRASSYGLADLLQLVSTNMIQFTLSNTSDYIHTGVQKIELLIRSPKRDQLLKKKSEQGDLPLSYIVPFDTMFDKDQALKTLNNNVFCGVYNYQGLGEYLLDFQNVECSLGKMFHPMFPNIYCTVGKAKYIITLPPSIYNKSGYTDFQGCELGWVEISKRL